MFGHHSNRDFMAHGLSASFFLGWMMEPFETSLKRELGLRKQEEITCGEIIYGFAVSGTTQGRILLYNLNGLLMRELPPQMKISGRWTSKQYGRVVDVCAGWAIGEIVVYYENGLCVRWIWNEAPKSPNFYKELFQRKEKDSSFKSDHSQLCSLSTKWCYSICDYNW